MRNFAEAVEQHTRQTLIAEGIEESIAVDIAAQHCADLCARTIAFRAEYTSEDGETGIHAEAVCWSKAFNDLVQYVKDNLTQ